MISFQMQQLKANILALFTALVFSPAALAAPHIVVDTNTGQVLSQEDAFQRWHPASLTKLMTAYVTLRALKQGDLTLRSPVRISRRAAKNPPSRMGYPVGSVLNIETALKIIIVKSANDVAYALGEAVGGSHQNFIRQMNKQAANLGMIDTNFINANGLHNPAQFSSAYDLALLASTIHREFPEQAELFKIPSLKTTKKVEHTYNLLLERLPGADGMKTGFVCASGYNMIGSATRNGRHIITVVLGENSQTARAVKAAKLLTQGFENQLQPIGDLRSLLATRGAVKKPSNRRSAMCSKKAIEARYDPGAGKAVIKSKWLKPRQVAHAPIPIALGNADGPSPAGILMPNGVFMALADIPTPKARPRILAIDQVDANDTLGALIKNTGRLAIPVERPTITQ